MNRFSQFNIAAASKSFVGDKIKISKILNREITVHEYKIEDSKVESFRQKGSDKCMYLQISFNNEMYVVFTASGALMEMITQVPKDKFPFVTTIIKDNDRFIFT